MASRRHPASTIPNDHRDIIAVTAGVPFYHMTIYNLLLCFTLLGSMIATGVAAPNPSPAQPFDVVIKNGTVYDGTGGEGRLADIALHGDRIVGVGDFKTAPAKLVIDAHGLAVA